MNSKPSGLAATYDDTWLLDGVRTPFAEFNGVLGGVSPTDMGIKVARELFGPMHWQPAALLEKLVREGKTLANYQGVK